MAGISIAPTDYAFAESPSWVRIDQTYNVQSWSIDRGRPNETSRTSTGQARIELVDKTGAFDPTNTGGAFYQLAPLSQAKIELQNPVTAAWSILYRGFISSIHWTPYVTEQWANVTLELVDALALFAACEMPPDFAVSMSGPGGIGGDYIDGNIVFDADPALTAVQTRINNVLNQLGWSPTLLRSIFTGNVALQKSVYAPRSSAMQVMADAADAEFPDVSNIYVSGPGHSYPAGSIVFHGRKARFNDLVAQYEIGHWKTGDDQAAAADPTHVVRVSPPLTASKDDTALYTSGFAIPQDPAGLFTDAMILGQYVQDATAVATKGLRTWSADSLLTDGGVGGSTGVQETKLFSNYVVQNYKTSQVRVGQLTIKSRNPAGSYGAATWQLLCGVDISDVVHLKTTHTGGGGFDTDFYVEGIHYVVRPGGATLVPPGSGTMSPLPYVELTLDVSPKSHYSSNPWPP